MTFFCYISFQHQQKVAVLGAAGGIGQPMSLLMKESPTISHLALYDIVNTPGRQFKPAFCRKSSVISTGMMRNTETELFENFIETLSKKYHFFPKGSVWIWEEEVYMKGVVKSANRAPVPTSNTLHAEATFSLCEVACDK